MSLKLVEDFASLLDNNQFDEASKLLAENCDYHYWEGNYSGRNNIISFYHLNDREGRKLYDELSYSSEVEEMTDGKYRILFIDKIRMGHKWHEYRCHQLIKIINDQIVHIEHSEIPGETESLRMFYSTSRSREVSLP